MKKIIRVFVFIMILFFTMVMSSWVVWYQLENNHGLIPKSISNAVFVLAKLPTQLNVFIVRNFLSSDVRAIADKTDRNGILRYGNQASPIPGKLLTASFNQNHQIEFKLVNLNDGKIIKTWGIHEDSIIAKDKFNETDKYTLRLTHPLMLADSSIIANSGTFLICINKNNTIKWVNTERFHHSIELDSDSAIWSCVRLEEKDAFVFSEKLKISDDAIVKVAPNTGKEIFKKSISKILTENGYTYLLALGNLEEDAIHLNEVYPALTSTSYWQKGDLLISLRNRSTVFLYRPQTNKIIWLNTGPWSNQHSCSFMDSSKIMVFGNDIIRNGKTTSFLEEINHIYIYDFSRKTTAMPYNNVLKKLAVKTITEGRVTYINNGIVFIDETNNGKVYFIDSTQPILKYTERYDKNHIKMFNWNRYIP